MERKLIPQLLNRKREGSGTKVNLQISAREGVGQYKIVNCERRPCKSYHLRKGGEKGYDSKFW